MAKRILNIVFNDFSNDARVLRQASEMVKAGYDVSVLALNNGEQPEFEQINGLKIHRTTLLTRPLPRSGFFQAFKYLEVCSRAMRWVRQAEVVHVHDLDPLPLGTLLKILSFGKIRLVYDSHELQTERNGLPDGISKEAKRTVESLLIKFSDGFVTVSDMIALEYEKTSGKLPVVIPNCPKFQDFPDKTSKLRDSLKIDPLKKIFLYQGILSNGRGVIQAVEAFKKLTSTEAVLVIMGSGSLAERVKEESEKADNIYYHPAVPYEELLQYTASADFGLVPIERNCLSHEYAMPNKFFEYAMAGVPVLSVAIPELSKLVDHYQCGATFNQATPDDIAEGVKNLLNCNYEKLRSGSMHLAKEYNWERFQPRLIDLYNNL